MIANTGFSDEVSVIAFYGIDPSPEAIRCFYLQALNWFEVLGYPIERMAVEGPGFSGNYRTFKRTHPKLQKVGFSSINSFSLAALLPDGKFPLFDFLIDITCITDNKPVAYIAVNSSLLRLPSEAMFRMADSAIECLKPIYGIGYRRSRQDGPTLYVVGIGQGIGPSSGKAYEEAVRHGHWGRLGMDRQVYREGVLRDVYPWNFLAVPHLTAQVNNRVLQDWIQEDEQRGHLKPLNDDVWLWEVNEENRLAVRSTLWNAGIIFNWKNYL